MHEVVDVLHKLLAPMWSEDVFVDLVRWQPIVAIADHISANKLEKLSFTTQSREAGERRSSL